MVRGGTQISLFQRGRPLRKCCIWSPTVCAVCEAGTLPPVIDFHIQVADIEPGLLSTSQSPRLFLLVLKYHSPKLTIFYFYCHHQFTILASNSTALKSMFIS